MNWIVESLASMGLLVLTQILVKVNSRAGVPASVINFATYVLVLAVFLFTGVGMEVNAAPPIYFLIFVAGIFTFLGNAASVRGWKKKRASSGKLVSSRCTTRTSRRLAGSFIFAQ